LIDNNITTPSDVVPKITVNPVKRNYEHLKGIRTNLKTVKIFDKKRVKLILFLHNIKQGVRLE